MSATPVIGIIGGGAWGTALAQAFAADGTRVRIWAREAAIVQAINADHRNPLFLPDAQLAPSIDATDSLGGLVGVEALLVVAPAQHARAVLAETAVGTTPLVLCSKGIEAATGQLMTQVAAAIHPAAPLAVLSGPTFAHEVAAGLPTAVTLACRDRALWDRLSLLLARPQFRPYYSDDLIGAEVGGAVKNVLAIGCGVVDGAGLGLNARAALIARGFAEMRRFGLALGARADTLSGLSGLGDLVLTCSSENSRNFALGRGLGEGRGARDLLAGKLSVAEGAHTAPVLAALARKHGIAMPIVDAVVALLAGDSDVRAVIGALLSRPLADEGDPG